MNETTSLSPSGLPPRVLTRRPGLFASIVSLLGMAGGASPVMRITAGDLRSSHPSDIGWGGDGAIPWSRRDKYRSRRQRNKGRSQKRERRDLRRRFPQGYRKVR